MKAYLGTLILSTVLLCSIQQAHSQQGISKYEIGVTVGTMIYQGDLTPSRIGSYRTPGPALNLFVNRLVNRSFAVRSSLMLGRLRGDDSKYANPDWRRERNFRFYSPVAELSGLVVWNPLGTNYRTGETKSLTPYLFGGAGISFLNSRPDASAFNAAYFAGDPGVISGLAQDGKHGTPKGILVLPVGAGLQYDLTPKFSLVGETSYRFTTTDYIDGFSQSANPTFFDHYLSHTIGIIYRPGRKTSLDCPVF
jgi:hypothetical protein